MNSMLNLAGSTTLIVFFVCGQVYPKQTAIVTLMILTFIFATPFLA